MTQRRFKNEIVNTIVGEDSYFKGSLNTQRSIRIDGVFEGDIHCQGQVIVGEGSKVTASIVAKQVVVSGEVNGSIEAISGLYISKTGRVYGDISGDQLTIEEGAIYRGRVNMDVISAKNEYEGETSISIK
jgi:cytoskeletal protein CcmA (bactofilin family)